MKMNRIGLKFGGVVIALMIFILVTLSFAIDRLFTNFYESQMKEEAQEIAAHFATMAASGDTSSKAMIRTFAKFSDVKIYWLDANGNILSGKAQRSQPAFIKKNNNRRLLAGHSLSFTYRDSSGGRYYVIGKPMAEAPTRSAFYLLSSMKKMDASLLRLRRLLILSGLGAFLMASGIILVMTKWLSRPLLQMQKRTEQMARGDWDTRLPIQSHDEIGMLGHSINDLAQSLQTYRDTRREFFANISHELRTPVTYLEGYSKVLLDNLVQSEREQKQYLSIIHQESVRLEHMINDLFELSKMEEGRMDLNFEWLDMRAIIDEAIGKVKLKAEKKRIGLQTKISGDSPKIYGDGKRMGQILLNLLENSIRYTEKGNISVQLSERKKTAILTVKDTGIGIPQESLPYLFDRFYRVEKSRSREYGGTGLGLSIVKKLVELQGGTIQVASEPGRGTVFKMIFPQKKRLEKSGAAS